MKLKNLTTPRSLPTRALAFTVLVCCGSSLADDKQPVLPKDSLPAKLDIHAAPESPGKRLIPKSNPLTDARVKLGRSLFFDPILSRNGTVSCASCHQPKHGFATPDKLAIGIDGQTGRRNSPSLLNRTYGNSMFWDGRSKSLEAQAMLPIVDPTEMGNTWPNVIRTLNSNKKFAPQFVAAFGDEKSKDPIEVITKENVGRALAAFQRTLLIGDSPVDAFQSGDHSVLTRSERQGMWIFESRGACWKCHSNSNYSDEKFHNTGVSFGTKNRDEGRFEFTKKKADRFAFKTPTLRGVALTAPYMHDGSLATLRDVVNFYNKGGSTKDESLDERIKPLGLSEEEVTDLVAFLKSLSRPMAATKAKGE